MIRCLTSVMEVVRRKEKRINFAVGEIGGWQQGTADFHESTVADDKQVDVAVWSCGAIGFRTVDEHAVGVQRGQHAADFPMQSFRDVH